MSASCAPRRGSCFQSCARIGGICRWSPTTIAWPLVLQRRAGEHGGRQAELRRLVDDEEVEVLPLPVDRLRRRPAAAGARRTGRPRRRRGRARGTRAGRSPPIASTPSGNGSGVDCSLKSAKARRAPRRCARSRDPGRAAPSLSTIERSTTSTAVCVIAVTSTWNDRPARAAAYARARIAHASVCVLPVPGGPWTSRIGSARRSAITSPWRCVGVRIPSAASSAASEVARAHRPPPSSTARAWIALGRPPRPSARKALCVGVAAAVEDALGDEVVGHRVEHVHASPSRPPSTRCGRSGSRSSGTTSASARRRSRRRRSTGRSRSVRAGSPTASAWSLPARSPSSRPPPDPSAAAPARGRGRRGRSGSRNRHAPADGVLERLEQQRRPARDAPLDGQARRARAAPGASCGARRRGTRAARRRAAGSAPRHSPRSGSGIGSFGTNRFRNRNDSLDVAGARAAALARRAAAARA